MEVVNGRVDLFGTHDGGALARPGGVQETGVEMLELLHVRGDVGVAAELGGEVSVELGDDCVQGLVRVDGEGTVQPVEVAAQQELRGADFEGVRSRDQRVVECPKR